MNNIEQYLINKFMGGRANKPPAKNIQYELQDGYGFKITTVFNKEGLTIKKKK